MAEDTATEATSVTVPDVTETQSTAPVTMATNEHGKLVDENGDVIIINGTSAVMSRGTTATTTAMQEEDDITEENTESTTTTTNTEVTTSDDEVYFIYLNSEQGYCLCWVGAYAGIHFECSDDAIYEIGETANQYTIEDESIAQFGIVQGSIINIIGISVGETVLTAVTPDVGYA